MKSFLILLVGVAVCHANSWSYANTNWAPHNPVCGGRSQSPINLTPSEATCGAGEGQPQVQLGGAFKGTGLNNGHAIQVNLPKDVSDATSVNIGGKAFKVLQFHFHWGKTNDKGSEHTVQGDPKSMEMHVVCSDGQKLAVLGFFYNIGSTNSALQPLVDVLNIISDEGSKTDVRINLAELVAPSVNGKFYRYQGSLTTPPCSEIVTWTVYQVPLQLSQAQIDAFRATSVGGNNFRPVQALNGRTLYNSAC